MCLRGVDAVAPFHDQARVQSNHMSVHLRRSYTSLSDLPKTHEITVASRVDYKVGLNFDLFVISVIIRLCFLFQISLTDLGA